MIKKDFYHDLCHNKSLAISFATGASRHRLTITKPPLRAFSYSLSIAWDEYITYPGVCQINLLLMLFTYDNVTLGFS